MSALADCVLSSLKDLSLLYYEMLTRLASKILTVLL